jgi:hypothetical protein
MGIIQHLANAARIILAETDFSAHFIGVLA